MPFQSLILSLLRGLGQIMLQESAWTGALFVVGLAANSWLMLAGALLGALCSTGGAKLLKLASDEEVQRGLFGFNGALVGIAIGYFYAPTISAVLLVVVAALLSSFIMRWFLHWRYLPPYTAPFVVSTWIALMAAHLFGIETNSFLNVSLWSHLPGDIATVFRGIGQVMFQEYWLSGVLFVVGLALCSRQAAAWAIIGSSLGLVFASGRGYPPDLVLGGIFGFNACLAGIALAGKFCGSAVEPFIGIILTVLLTRGFQALSVPPLTAPFVIATWLVIMGSWLVQRNVPVK